MSSGPCGDRRGVHRVVTRDRLEQQRRVGDGVGERPDLVEARREGDQAEPADRAVGRLDADDAAQRGRLADRAAGVRAERERREVGGDRRRRTAARPAGHPRGVVRVARRAERRVLGARPHRELVEVGLADDDRAGVVRAWSRSSRRTAASTPRGSSTSTSSGRPGCTCCPSARPGRRRAAGIVAERHRSSISAARARASSASTRLNAWISSSRSAISARCRSTTSTALVTPLRTFQAMSAAVVGMASSATVSPPAR